MLKAIVVGGRAYGEERRRVDHHHIQINNSSPFDSKMLQKVMLIQSHGHNVPKVHYRLCELQDLI